MSDDAVFQEGFAAHGAGKSLEDCPYVVQERENEPYSLGDLIYMQWRSDWSRGWLEGQKQAS